MKYKNMNLLESGIKILYILIIFNVKRDVDMVVF